MIYLVLSIFSTTLLFIIFKFFQRLHINTFQAVVINYLTAACLGASLNWRSLNGKIFEQNWIEIALILGVLFISVFHLLGYTAQNIGVTVSSVANKMSMVIPVIAAVELYNDQLNFWKIAGIFIALAAVLLTSIKNRPPGPGIEQTTIQNKSLLVVIPLLLFLGSGILDSLLNFAQALYLSKRSFGTFITCVFTLSGLIGTAIVAVKLIRGDSVDRKTILGGIVLGIVNYFSLYCFLNALEIRHLQSSVVLPVNNIGIVMCSALGAYVIFGEKLSLLNWTGIMLAIVSILLISFS